MTNTLKLVAAILALSVSTVAGADECRGTYSADYFSNGHESWHGTLAHIVSQDDEAAAAYAAHAKSIPEWLGQGRVYLAEPAIPTLTWRAEYPHGDWSRIDRVLMDWNTVADMIAVLHQSDCPSEW